MQNNEESSEELEKQQTILGDEQEFLVQGELVKFIYIADEGGFAVAHIKPLSGVDALTMALGTFVAVGNIAHAIPGNIIYMRGEWSRNSTYGHQYKVDRAIVKEPQSIRGLKLYVQGLKIKGLGKKNAQRIVDHFGMQTLQILHHSPERLTEISGIGSKKIQDIIEHLKKQDRFKEIKVALRGMLLGPSLIDRLIQKYDEDTLGFVKRKPYQLMSDISGVGFKTADKIALLQGITPEDPMRIRAGIEYILSQSETEGHSYLTRVELIRRTIKLHISEEPISEMIEEMIDKKALVSPVYGRVYRPISYYTERKISNRLLALRDAPKQKGLFSIGELEEIDENFIQQIEEKCQIHLHEQQREALYTAMNRGLSVITGGPGTGKTTIVQCLIVGAQMRGERWVLAAPTGRAAKRLSETTGIEAQTIHRLLSFNGHTKKFTHNEDHPIAAHGILIDEASMLDMWLMNSILQACKNGTRLILVGDVDQLPSVGSGRVLGDIIDSNVIPVVRLTKVYRQAQNSCIVRNAHRINSGKTPISAEKDVEIDQSEDTAKNQPQTQQEQIKKDFFILYKEEQVEIRNVLIRVINERLPKNKGFHPLKDIQVLTPMHSGQLGTTILNQTLQNILNPNGACFEYGQREFRVGDRVLQIKNDYDTDIYNGDIGFVEEIIDDGIVVRFDDRALERRGSQLQELELAYAISIHKSQGSEYKAAIVIIHNAHRIMLRRNLLYTAITRAKEFCCIIGHPWAVSFCASESSQEPRNTSLEEFLQKKLEL